MIVTASNSLMEGIDLDGVSKVVIAKQEESKWWPDGPALSPRWTFVPVGDHFQMRFDDLPISDYRLMERGDVKKIRNYGMNQLRLMDQSEKAGKSVRWPMIIEMFSRAVDARNAKTPASGEPPVKVASKSKKEDEVLKGGKADGMTVEDVAKMHKSSLADMKEQLRMGLEIEREHSPDLKTRTEISLDHLVESKVYYTMLTYMEKAAEGAKEDGLPDGLCPYAYQMAKAYVKGTEKDWNYITPEDLKRDLDKGKKHFLLDVRKPEDFKEGHIKGAMNIFWLDLFEAKSLKRLPRDKKIVVYCYVGHTSSQAVVFLKLLGFDAVGLKFGMGESPVEGVPVAGWKDFGFETVEGRE